MGKYKHLSLEERWVTQIDEAPKTSFWVNFIRALRNHGSSQTRSDKKVLARSQFSCFDTRTGLLESRKLDIFSVVPNNRSRFTEEAEFNLSGHPFRHSIVWYGPSGRANYSRKELFDWKTGIPVETEECYPLAPDWSVRSIIKTFDPETGEVAQEQRWTRIEKDNFLDTNSGTVMTFTRPLLSYLQPSHMECGNTV